LKALAPLALLLALWLGHAGATELDPTSQARLGLRLATLVDGRMPATTRAVAEVLDPVPLARAVDELEAAQAAAHASRAELERTQALFAAGGNASRKALEAAQAQAIADRARLRQARVALQSRWGDDLASMPPTRRSRLVEALVDGHQVLLKAEPLDRPDPGSQVHAATLQMPHGAEVGAGVLGRLPRSTSGLAAGWLLQADAGSLVPGMVLTARLHGAGSPVRGVLLPRAAIVRWNGLDWTYVATGTSRFERRAVHPLAMTPDGWLVGAPFKPGERVVVEGAEALVAVDAAPVPGSADTPGD